MLLLTNSHSSIYLFSCSVIIYLYTSSQDILQSYKILRTSQLCTEGTYFYITSQDHFIKDIIYTRRSVSKNLPLPSPASYLIINPAAGWSPFSISHSSATQQGVVASSDQLQAIEAVQPTPPCRGAIQGLRHQSLVCREGKRP